VEEAIARLGVIADTYLSMNAPVQLALPEFLRQREGFQSQVMARIRGNLAELDRGLLERPSCNRLEVEGGWYAVLRIPGVQCDEDFAVELLTKQGVYVHPGHFYNFSGDGHLVISLITPPGEFAEGVQRLLACI
jgi:aspartate/methionine/tyrosine aminotransferase